MLPSANPKKKLDSQVGLPSRVARLSLRLADTILGSFGVKVGHVLQKIHDACVSCNTHVNAGGASDGQWNG